MLKCLLGGGQKITENEAENVFLSSLWINHKNAKVDIIKSKIYNIKNFVETQNNFEYYFTENEYNILLSLSNLKESNRSKTMIRYGVPCKYIKGLINSMFIDKEKIRNNNEMKELYKIRFFSVFKNRDPKNYGDYVPYMTNESKLEESISYTFLNEEGINNLKELCWLLYSVIPKIEFCPYLINVISLCLVFMDKEETFFCLKNIILNDYNRKDLNMLRFKFRFSFEENYKIVHAFIKAFTQSTKNIGMEITNKMEKINFQFENLIQDMFFNFYFDYFNFTFLTVFLMCFLREGTKIFYRFAYAIFKTLRKEILEIGNPKEVISTIREKCFQLKDINSFLKYAFYFKLNHYNNKFNEIEYFKTINNKININYYVPTIDRESNIVNDEDIFKLWNMFPSQYSNRDAKMIYSTDYFDKTFNKLYEICSMNENSCLNSLVLLETKEKEKLGVLMSSPFDKKREGFYSPSFIIVFTIKPQMKAYKKIKDNNNIVFCSDEKIIIGLDQQGPIIQIDSDMAIGFSFPTEVFGNEKSLTKNNSFQIEKLEIYSLY